MPAGMSSGLLPISPMNGSGPFSGSHLLTIAVICEGTTPLLLMGYGAEGGADDDDEAAAASEMSGGGASSSASSLTKRWRWRRRHAARRFEMCALVRRTQLLQRG